MGQACLAKADITLVASMTFFAGTFPSCRHSLNNTSLIMYVRYSASTSIRSSARPAVSFGGRPNYIQLGPPKNLCITVIKVGSPVLN